jgi:hypothetical protein
VCGDAAEGGQEPLRMPQRFEACDIHFEMNAPKRTSEPVSDTPDNVSRLLRALAVALPDCLQGPDIGLASARLGPQRTDPFLHCGRRCEGIPEQPHGSRIRHEDEKNLSAILMRNLLSRRWRHRHPPHQMGTYTAICRHPRVVTCQAA